MGIGEPAEGEEAGQRRCVNIIAGRRYLVEI